MAAPTVLLTRPGEQIETTAQALENAGYPVIRLPLIGIAPPARPPTGSELRWAEQADWMIFTSRHAVNAAIRLWSQAPTRIAAIGAATAQALSAAGWPVHWQAPAGNSESLLDARDAPRWQGAIALMSGSGGRRQLKQALSARGCRTRKLLLYRRQALEPQPASLRAALSQRPLLVFTSGFAMRQWQRLMQAHNLPQGLSLDLLVASPRLCKLANQLGFDARVQALPSVSDRALLATLKTWNR